MARDPDKLAASFETKNTGGLLSGLLTEEDVFDRRTLWRLGSWGVAAVGALVVAFYANQSSIALHRDQVSAADLARQAHQIQSVAKESQNETRRLASAIETLNSDRDRLYSRVTSLEQGLDSVTGTIAKQSALAASPPVAPTPSAPTSPPPTADPQPVAQNPAPAPVVTSVPTVAAKSADKPPAEATAAEQGPAKVASVAPKPPPAQNPAAVPVVSPVATTARKTTDPKTTDKPATEAAAPEQPKVASLAPKSPDAPAATPATPLMAAKSLIGPPDPAATKLIEPEKPASTTATAVPAKLIPAAPMPAVVASTSAADDAQKDAPATAAPKLAVQRTEFGVDVGGANSVGGLRALWRGLLKSRSNAALTTLRPIIVIREGSNGLGMQLRLVAGPLSDAAAAARICAGLTENDRPCETAVFDGQRLAMTADEPETTTKPAITKPAPVRPSAHRRGNSRRVTVEEPPRKPEPSSTISSFFRRER